MRNVVCMDFCIRNDISFSHDGAFFAFFLNWFLNVSAGPKPINYLAIFPGEGINFLARSLAKKKFFSSFSLIVWRPH